MATPSENHVHTYVTWDSTIEFVLQRPVDHVDRSRGEVVVVTQSQQ
jgi:hypothetical protein